MYKPRVVEAIAGENLLLDYVETDPSGRYGRVCFEFQFNFVGMNFIDYIS